MFFSSFDQQAVDLFLRRRGLAAALADVMPHGGCRSDGDDLGADQVIVDQAVAGHQALTSAGSQQPRIARAGADQ